MLEPTNYETDYNWYTGTVDLFSCIDCIDTDSLIYSGELIVQTDDLDQNLVNGIVNSLGSFHQHLLSPTKRAKANR